MAIDFTKYDRNKIPTGTYDPDDPAAELNFDNGRSAAIMDREETIIQSVSNDEQLRKVSMNSDIIKTAMHGANLFNKDEIDLYHKIYRFGLYNPYGAVSNLREYLFFTKPDLNIIKRKDDGSLDKDQAASNHQGICLSEGINSDKFWINLFKDRKDTIKMLQNSYDPGWNMLLQNSVASNLEIPALEGTTIDSPVNNYGVGFQYRGTSEASDDSLEFSLEFRDTKYLDVFTFFKAYDYYEVKKHHGVVAPWVGYILNKVLHDQFSIYKFIVDEDAETLVYWCKFYGVMPMNVPRDVFSSTEMQNGISYSINFKAAFMEDMTEYILKDFNLLNKQFVANHGNAKYQYENYNENTHTVDFRPATAAFVDKYKDNNSPMGWSYKLKWKGDVQF